MQRAAEAAGIPGDWVDAARRCPVHALINELQGGAAAAPGVPHDADGLVHPAAVAGGRRHQGHRARRRGRDNLFGAIDTLRIPVEYLANLFTAGDVAPVNAVLRKLAAMRSYMRDINLGRDPDESIPAAVGMEGEAMYDMFRLLALAKYDERYVIPAAHAEQAHALEELATDCAVSDYGGGNPEIFGEGSGRRRPRSRWRTSEMLQQRQTSDTLGSAGGQPRRGRVNLLNWDGKGMPPRGSSRGSKRRRRPMFKVSARHDAGARPSEQACARPGRSCSTAARLPDDELLAQPADARASRGRAARRAAARR